MLLMILCLLGIAIGAPVMYAIGLREGLLVCREMKQKEQEQKDMPHSSMDALYVAVMTLVAHGHEPEMVRAAVEDAMRLAKETM